MQFTKEQLIEHIKGGKEFADECAADSTLHPERREYYELTAEALRIALASLEAEPVAWISERNLKNLGKSYSVYVKHEPVMVRPIPLFTAPPAPVVNTHPLLEFAKEYIESWDLGMAGDSGLLESARRAIADSATQQPAPVSVPLTDEQIDEVLDSQGNILYVIADKRERLRMFAREILRTAMRQGEKS